MLTRILRCLANRLYWGAAWATPEGARVAGREFLLRDGTCWRQPDYDDGWFVALAIHASVIFDVGANVGEMALLASFSQHLRQLVLVEANPIALSIAAENVIRNGLSEKTRFICAFADSEPGKTVEFWTIGSGQAGSVYASHAQSASRTGQPTTTRTVSLDWLCDFLGVYPDLVKLDVEGAEMRVLVGATRLVSERDVRFLVEVHSNAQLSIAANTDAILNWCREVRYRPYYLKEHSVLESSDQVKHRGRYHVLLQPQEWPLPDWLLGISQSASIEDSLNHAYAIGVHFDARLR